MVPFGEGFTQVHVHRRDRLAAHLEVAVVVGGFAGGADQNRGELVFLPGVLTA